MRTIMSTIEAQLETLSSRDRKLLAGLTMFFGVVFVGFLWWTLYGTLQGKAEDVTKAKDALREVLVEEARFQAAQAELEANESRLARYRSQTLSAYLEKVASTHNILDQLKSVNELTTTQAGNIKQTNYKVDLKKVPIREAVEFIYAIESSGYPLRIETASFRVITSRGEKTMDISLEMVVYSLSQS